LGGEVVILSAQDSQLGRGERSPIPPACCRAMSMPSMLRTTEKAKLDQMVQYATVL